VLGVLRAQSEELSASLASAAIVRVGADSSFTVIRTEHSQTGGSFWGVFWEALFGLTFRVPDRPPAADSNVGQLFGTIDRAGLDEHFRAEVRRAFQSGSSALALFALNWDAESWFDELYLRPDAYVRSRLTPQQETDLLTELGRAPSKDSGGVVGA
jgi:uncharacterized membrane protein